MQSTTARLRRRSLLLGSAAATVLPALSRAETWPARPIRLVIPFGAGGSVDVVGRLLAEHWGRSSASRW